MKRALVLCIFLGACSGDKDGLAVPDAGDIIVGILDARPDAMSAADARPGTPDARPGTPDARPAPDSRPGTPDAGAPDAQPQAGPDARPINTGPACTTFDNPIAGSVTFPVDGSVDVYDIATQGSRVFLAAGALGIRIYDLDAGGHATLRTTYATPGNAWGVTIAGDLLYVADGDDGLLVLDVSDPTAPVQVGDLAFTGAQRVVVAGNFAYVASWAVALRVVEITDPTTPVLASQYGNTTQEGYDVAVSGGRAYVSDYSGKVLIFNVANPYAVSLLGTVDLGFTDVGGIAAAGDIFYVAHVSLGLEIYDATSPSNAKSIGGYDGGLWTSAEDVDLDGTTLYLADGTGGLDILDVRTPAAPLLLGTYRVPGDPTIVGLAGGFVVTGSINGLSVIDPHRVDAVSQVAATSPPGSFPEAIRHTMVTDGQYIYVAGSTEGVEVVDLSSGVPTRVATAKIAGGYAQDLVYSDGKLYVSGAQAGLVIFDVSQPLHPVVLGSLPLAEVTGPLALAGDWVYLYGYGDSLFSVFVGNPAKPGLGGSLANVGSIVYAVRAQGDYVYLADDYAGLSAIDVSDPYHPMAAGTARLNQTNNSAHDLALSGNLALVATSEQGLDVVDLSDPANPVLLSTFDTPGNALSVAVAGHFAYVVDSQDRAPGNIEVIDFSTPAAPTLALSLDAPQEVGNVMILGHTLLVLVDNSAEEDQLILRAACGQ